MATARFTINGHDYTRYVKAKTGLIWKRENTNDEDAGRDTSQEMHTNVTSHQRVLSCTLGPMSFETAQQLAQDLQDNDAGVAVTYPDLYDGMATSRMFYNTTLESALESFRDEDIVIDNVKFTLTSVKEDTV